MRFGVICLISIMLIAIAYISPSYAQVTDQTIGGIIVPKVTSTQSLYCFNGSCSTGGTPKVNPTYVHSTDHYPVLLISLSQTCEVLNKYNMKGCPSVKDLIKYDTSNQYVSGKFVDKDGRYYRTPPQMKNNWLVYQHSNKIITCVECYFDVTATAKSKQIIIMPNSFAYVNKTESENKNYWYNFANRYMQGCDIATIGNSTLLLNDTIHFMLAGCTADATDFHAIQNHTKTSHPFSYNNPFSTLNQINYLKNILHGHTSSNTNMTSGGSGPSDCIRHQCNFIDPYKKAGW